MERQILSEKSKQVVHLISHTKVSFYQEKLPQATNKETFQIINCDIRRVLDEAAQACNQRHEVTMATPTTLCVFSSPCPSDVHTLIRKCTPKSCLLDPLPTQLLTDSALLQLVASSITAIIAKSLEAGGVPVCLKKAQVTPLLKTTGLDLINYKNYRPVLNIPFLGKVLEKLVAM